MSGKGASGGKRPPKGHGPRRTLKDTRTAKRRPPGSKTPTQAPAAPPWWEETPGTDGKQLDLEAAASGGTRSEELKREVLAKYGERPISETIEHFCERVGIGRGTWYAWRHQEKFAEALEEIQRQRARINLDRMHEGVEALDSRVMMDAIDGNTTAQVTAYRRLGFIREGATQVQINRVDGDPMSDEAIAKLEERLAENLRIVTEYPQDKPKAEGEGDGEV